MSKKEPRLPGWYLAKRSADQGLACFFYHGRGWWQIAGRKQRLPEGWGIGPAIAELLTTIEGFRLDRKEVAI